MAKYDITHTCGHSETVQLIGPHRERESRIGWLESHLCPRCWEAEKARKRADEVAQAAEAASADGLPPLEGTPKQVAWAETIRRHRMVAVAELRTRPDASPEELTRLERAVANLRAQRSATWWIDTREEWMGPLLRKAYDLGAPAPVATAAQEIGVEEDAKAEATIRPPAPKSETVAEIRVLGDRIEVFYPESRRDFWEVVKPQLRFEWSRDRWVRKMTVFSGPADIRAVEVASRLLAAGFVVRLFQPELRAKVIAGDVEPECRRWVAKRTADPHEGWFAITWPREEDFWQAAKLLAGSRWDREHHSMHVPPEHFEQVLDFAESYGFRLTPGAQDVAAEARVARDRALVADITLDVTAPPAPPSGKPAPLPVPAEVKIEPALRDE